MSFYVNFKCFKLIFKKERKKERKINLVPTPPSHLNTIFSLFFWNPSLPFNVNIQMTDLFTQVISNRHTVNLSVLTRLFIRIILLILKLVINLRFFSTSLVTTVMVNDRLARENHTQFLIWRNWSWI